MAWILSPWASKAFSLELCCTESPASSYKALVLAVSCIKDGTFFPSPP